MTLTELILSLIPQKETAEQKAHRIAMLHKAGAEAHHASRTASLQRKIDNLAHESRDIPSRSQSRRHKQGARNERDEVRWKQGSRIAMLVGKPLGYQTNDGKIHAEKEITLPTGKTWVRRKHATPLVSRGPQCFQTK